MKTKINQTPKLISHIHDSRKRSLIRRHALSIGWVRKRERERKFFLVLMLFAIFLLVRILREINFFSRFFFLIRWNVSTTTNWDCWPSKRMLEKSTPFSWVWAFSARVFHIEYSIVKSPDDQRLFTIHNRSLILCFDLRAVASSDLYFSWNFV